MRILALIVLISIAAAQDEYLGYVGRWVDVAATAYSPADPIDSAYHASKGERWRWITADGRTDVRDTPYGIAVPLSNRKPMWAFGTQVIIPPETGYVAKSRPNRLFTVDDVGNGRQYWSHRAGLMHVDLRFKSHDSAIAWAGPAGWRKIRVFLAHRPVEQPPPLPADLFGE